VTYLNRALSSNAYYYKDSAEWYENEKETGQTILDFCQSSGVPRSEIFYTTKLKLNHGYDHVRRAIEKSVETCGLGYIDLYLIHGPIGGLEARRDSWRAICDAQKEGTLRSIEISTHGIRHMEELVAMGLPLPVINQVCLFIQLITIFIVYFLDRLTSVHGPDGRCRFLQGTWYSAGCKQW
jgi:diketogulonate reductase-like aldo/keto reductase